MRWFALAVFAFTLGLTATMVRPAPSAEAQGNCYIQKFDLNQDNVVDQSDYFLAERWFEAGEVRMDLDGSGNLVKLLDLGLIANHMATCVNRGGGGGGNAAVGVAADGSALTAQGVAGVDGVDGMDVLPPQTGGPDSFGYTYQDSRVAGCPARYVSLAGLPGVTVQPPGDDTNTPVNTGFNFPFYGTVATQVTVSNNGHLGVGPTALSFTNLCPWAAGAPPIIAPFWDDMFTAGATRWGTFATCPGGRESPCFIAEWADKNHFTAGGGPYTFEVFLFPSGKIEVVLATITPTGAPTSATTGIRGAGAGQFLAYGVCNTDYFSPVSLQSPRAIYFLPPGVTTCLAAGAGGIGVTPNDQLGCQVHLPILNFQGADDVCRTWIEVQYIGGGQKDDNGFCEDFGAKAVLVTWGEPGFCPPQAAGPLKVECTGLLVPGASWLFSGSQVPTGSKSGILFKFTALQLSDVGLADELGFDDVVADLMCEELFFGVVGDADDYRRFKKAYNEGGTFRSIPQNIAMGPGALAVEVLRKCPGDLTPGVDVTSKYNGIAGTHLGVFDNLFGGFGYYVPLIYADKAGLNTVMYIQNGGIECSSIEIWFKAQDDCLRARICDITTLAPGESYQYDATDCVGPDWQGSAWVRSSEPMGIAVDIFGRDVLMTYVAEPAPFDYVMTDENGVRTGTAVVTAERVAFGPLIYSEYQGWDTGIQVQNLSPVYAAKVKVYFLDRSGDIITTLVDWVCPRGSQTFFLPVVHDLPGNWVGSVRVESQDWWTPGTKEVVGPPIVGVVTLLKYSDAVRTETDEAIAYELLPEHKSYIWQVGSDSEDVKGGLFSGVGLIAIPSLFKDLDDQGITSELAIMNLAEKPGFTDFAIIIYDQNGLLDFVCQKLHDRQVEYIDLQTWGYVNPGFIGSAIISATFWEHDVFGPTGQFVRNVMGLGAVNIERSGTRLGENIPGDEGAGARGIPFQQTRDLEWCQLGFIPICPGQPVTPKPTATPVP
jgi:hypothetical protein